MLVGMLHQTHDCERTSLSDPTRQSPSSGGLIGLGGAQFHLPLLIAVFALYPHRAIRINLLISLVRPLAAASAGATLVMSAVSRLSFVHATSVTDYKAEIGGMLAGGIIAAWLGAGYLSRIPKSKIIGVIAALLIGTAGLLAVETTPRGSTRSSRRHATEPTAGSSGRVSSPS